MKRMIIAIAFGLSCGFAFGDSISNLSQVVGMDITREVCQSMPVGSGFANWEITALATLRAIRTGDATNFVANSTSEMLYREFEISLTNGVPATFAHAFSQTSAEFSRYRITSYDITTNTVEAVALRLNVQLGRSTSTNDISDTINFYMLKTNDVWKVDGI